MPTVDDLVISLTIKETSNLGKLRKQLDELTSYGGKLDLTSTSVKLPETYFVMESDVEYIRKKIDFLYPTVTYSYKQTKEFMRDASSTLLAWLDRVEDLKRYILSADESKMGRIKKSLGVSQDATREEIEEGFEALHRGIAEKLRAFSAGYGLGPKAQRILVNIKNMISAVNEDSKRQLEFIKKLIEGMGEPQEIFEKILDALGVLVDAQYKTMILTDDLNNWLSMTDEELKEIDENLPTAIANVKEKIEEVEDTFEDIFEKGGGFYDLLEEALIYLKENGEDSIDLSKHIIEQIDDLDDDLQKRVIASIIKANLKTGRRTVLPQPLYDVFMKKFVAVSGLKKLFKETHEAIDISGYDLAEKLRDYVSDDSKEVLDELKDEKSISVELKDYLGATKEEMDKIREQAEIHGKKLLVIAEYITREAEIKLNKMGVKYIIVNVRKIQELLDLVKPISNIKEVLKQMSKELLWAIRDLAGDLHIFTKKELEEYKKALPKDIKEAEELVREGEERLKKAEQREIKKEIEKYQGQLKSRRDLLNNLKYIQKQVLRGLEELKDNMISYDKFKEIIEGMNTFQKIIEENELTQAKIETMVKVIYDNLVKNWQDVEHIEEGVNIIIDRLVKMKIFEKTELEEEPES